MACHFATDQDFAEHLSSSGSFKSILSFNDSPPGKTKYRGSIKLSEPVLLQSQGSDVFSEDEIAVKIKLPRGGAVIQTRIGPIQFGMVPETVKDSLIMGLDVPTIYIMPSHRFDKQFCLSVAEFEFPAYFNFFVKKTKVILVCDEAGEQAVRQIFQETLLGPKDLSQFDKDFTENYVGRPDIVKELKHFAKNPFNPSEPLTLDLLLTFVIFNAQGKADLGQNISVQKQGNRLLIMDGDKLLSRIKDKVDIMVDTHASDEYEKYGLFANPFIEKNQDQTSGYGFREKFIKLQFQPPCFGITILGSSHGFDPKGSTSGYIVWINGRGVMVDPPPYSTLLLRQMGVPSSFIKGIIVTHTHADHDAGSFQKILESEKIELITTRTIMESFVRKYAAVTNYTCDYIKTLFTFRPVIIGRPVRVNGAEFHFHYSLHSIPCVGFTVKVLDKSIYFSGDTFYDPEGVTKMFQSGVLSQDRCDQLLSSKKWDNSLILHEAGVPPIHTPAKVLAQLPAEIKSKMKLIHVASKDIPADCGLEQPISGVEASIILIKDSYDEKLQVIKSLNLIHNIHIFQKASFRHIKDIYEVVYEKTFQKDETVCIEGQTGDEFYIIKNGCVKIHSNNKDHHFERYLYEGDYFGEACFFGNHLRSANATSVTDGTVLMIIQKDDFLYIFGDTQENQQNQEQQQGNILGTILGLQENRDKYYSLISKNQFFSQLSSSQKLQLELLFTPPKLFKTGSKLWNVGIMAEFAIFVCSGKVQIIIPSTFSIQKDTNSPIKLVRKSLNPTSFTKDLKRGSVPVALSAQQLEVLLQARKTKDTDHTEVMKQQKQIFIYGEGKFIGEVDSIMKKQKFNTIVEVVEDAELIVIRADALISFLQSNPGLQLLFKDSIIVE